MVARDTDAQKSIPQVASELWEMSTAYAKQETIDPLKGVGRFVGMGGGGAALWLVSMPTVSSGDSPRWAA